MGIARVANFPFPEPPPRHALEAAHTSLRSLGALDGSAEVRDTPNPDPNPDPEPEPEPKPEPEAEAEAYP